MADRAPLVLLQGEPSAYRIYSFFFGRTVLEVPPGKKGYSKRTVSGIENRVLL